MDATGDDLEVHREDGGRATVADAASFDVTDDTEELAADRRREQVAATMALAAEATRFDVVALPADQARQLELIRRSVPLPAPRAADAQVALTRTTTALEGLYATGKCDGKDLGELSRVMAESRDPAILADAWRGWRKIAAPMREPYVRYVALANEGARDLGYADVGAFWRSGYDMAPERFAEEVGRLWQQVEPLYDALHAYTRDALLRAYGPETVRPGGLIPAHVVGNMWGHDWGNIYPLLAADAAAASNDMTTMLRTRGIDEVGMVRLGERFFTSIGFDPLPTSFWERSLFTKPLDREVECHPSAWSIDGDLDLRIKMCIEITGEQFFTIHHELGHVIYERAYRHQPFLYRDGANDAFHEAIGEAIGLSMTPRYLVQVGLLDTEPPEGQDVQELLRTALDRVPYLPFALLADTWRWRVFADEVGPAEYNAAWWDLVRIYQRMEPPVPRTEADFDPGAKYHIAASVPLMSYFIAFILQFQFHRAFARISGFTGPLHQYSLFGDRTAGRRLSEMLAMGRSKPWSEALYAVTGERAMDAGAMLEYFAPLQRWLDEQNRTRSEVG